jgi:protoheme IX farnesyltransferase
MAGLLVAPGTIHPLIAAVTLLCIAVGAGASGAINMWYDRDIDAVMERTRLRPIPTGRVAPGDAFGFGVVLAIGAVALMGLAVNVAAAALLAVAILYYVFVYTIWLKRRTPQNIVIGGAAGAFPPMIGWAAVTGTISVEPLLLFALIFFWTPPHFWALAITRASEYKAANVPMLPVVAGEKTTRRHIFLYSLLLVGVSFGPVWVGFSGALYGVAAGVLGSVFILLAFFVLISVSFASCRRLFGYSILYLFLLFLTLGVDHMLGSLSLSLV